MRSVRDAISILVLATSCGDVPEPTSTDDAATYDPDAPAAYELTVAPSSFLLHAKDTREMVLTVTNPTDHAPGIPTFAASGQMLGTVSFSDNTCTAALAKGDSCTAKALFTVTSAGEVSFDVIASASGSRATSASVHTKVMPACPANCGPSGTANCCASSLVLGNAVGATLAGETFYRGHDASTMGMTYKDMTKPATVSDFRLDKYEVTVGRFRAFLNAGYATKQNPPAADAGAHPKIPGSGWQSGWNISLAADTSALSARINCNPMYQTWTDEVGANEALPMNCVSFFDAMAFCAWDGGLVPTEAEWHYAASGGSEQRAYPWSNPPGSTGIDCSYANYKNDSPLGAHCANDKTGGLNRVGSASPKGDGKWGHSDLAGSLWEFTKDLDAPYPVPCDDCTYHTGPAAYRALRGGAYYVGASDVRVGKRGGTSSDYRDPSYGIRCARSP